MQPAHPVRPARYHRALVALHWLLAVLLLAALAIGTFVLKTVPNSSLDKLLMLFIALHIAAALYHQVVRRDGLLARMGFGRR